MTDINSIGLAAEHGGANAVVAINPIAMNVYDLYEALDIPVIGVDIREDARIHLLEASIDVAIVYS